MDFIGEKVARLASWIVLGLVIHPVISVVGILAIGFNFIWGWEYALALVVTVGLFALVLWKMFPKVFKVILGVLRVFRTKSLARHRLNNAFGDLRLDGQDSAFSKAPRIKGIKVMK